MNIAEAEKLINELLALEVADSYPDSSSRLDAHTQAFQVGYLRRQLAEAAISIPGVWEALNSTLEYVKAREAGSGLLV